MEPVALVDSRLTDKAKRDPENWILLGYMPEIERMSAAMRRTFSARGSAENMMARDYHHCMSVMLAPLMDFIVTQPIVKSRRGQFIRRQKVITEIPLVTLDNKAACMACARVTSKGPASNRMTRRCLTSFSDASKPHHVCFPVDGYLVQLLSQAALGCTYGAHAVDNGVPDLQHGPVRQLIQARLGRDHGGTFLAAPPVDHTLQLPSIPLSDHLDRWLQYLDTLGTDTKRKTAIRVRRQREKLAELLLKKVLGSKVVDNPFARLPYGANRNEIHAATTADILHVIKNGLVPKLLVIIFGLMPDSQQAAIDRHVDHMFASGMNRSCETDRLPRVSFHKGYTKLTELSGSERMGQVFVLALLLRTKTGRELIQPRLAPDFDEKRRLRKEKLKGKKGSKVRYVEEDEDDVEDDEEYTEEPIEDEEDAGEEDESTSRSFSPMAALSFLELHDTIEELRKPGGLPHNLLVKMNDLLEEFLTDKRRKALWVAHNSIGGLPSSPLLDYRPTAEPSKRISHCTTTVEEMKTQELLHPPSPLEFTVKAVPNRSVPPSIGLSIDELSFVVETLLTFWSYLEYPTMEALSPSNQKKASQNLELLRRVLVEGTNRGENTYGYSFQKFIEMAHQMLETPAFGKASGKDTNDGERHLKGWAVRPAKTAQKRDDATFTGQVSLRSAEARILRKVRDSNRVQKETKDATSDTVTLPFVYKCRGLYRFVVRDDLFSFESKYDVDPVLVRWLTEESDLLETIGDFSVDMFTQTKLEDGTVLRCHPNFEGKGPRYDCITIPHNNEMVPARVIALYRDPALVVGTIATHAVVAVVDYNKRDKKNDSQIFKMWTWKYKKTGLLYESVLEEVPITALKNSVYCIDLNPSRPLLNANREAFRMLECRSMRMDWPEQFLQSSGFLAKEMTED
jgi:hypothetical protein